MTRRPIVLALLLSLLAIGHAAASDLPTTKPEQVGLSSERLGRIGQVLRADVERGRIPGAVVVVARKGRVASLQAVGFRDKAAGTPMAPDSIFRIASMTKPIVTVAALSLYEEGRLLPSDPVSKYIPAFKNQAVGLERALAERVYRPLKMTDTTFLVPADKRARIAQGLPAHPDTGVEFKLADPSVPRKFDCGGGCAVSTAGDYARFAQMLLNRGTLDGARVLSPRTVEFMTADHLGAISRGTGATAWPGYTWGLGVAVRQDKGIAPIPGSAGDFYWPGAFATYWWADPKEELAVVFMTQSPLGRHYQHLVRGLVYQAIAH